MNDETKMSNSEAMTVEQLTAEENGRRAAFGPGAKAPAAECHLNASADMPDEAKAALAKVVRENYASATSAKTEAKPAEQPSPALAVEPLSEADIKGCLLRMNIFEADREWVQAFAAAKDVAELQRSKIRHAKLPTVEELETSIADVCRPSRLFADWEFPRRAAIAVLARFGAQQSGTSAETTAPAVDTTEAEDLGAALLCKKRGDEGWLHEVIQIHRDRESRMVAAKQAEVERLTRERNDLRSKCNRYHDANMDLAKAIFEMGGESFKGETATQKAARLLREQAAQLDEQERFRVAHAKQWSDTIRRLCAGTGIDSMQTEEAIIDTAARTLSEQREKLDEQGQSISEIQAMRDQLEEREQKVAEQAAEIVRLKRELEAACEREATLTGELDAEIERIKESATQPTQPSPAEAPMPRLERIVTDLHLDTLPASVDPESCSVGVYVMDDARADMAEARAADAKRIAELEAELYRMSEALSASGRSCDSLAKDCVETEKERDEVRSKAEENAQAASELAELREFFAKHNGIDVTSANASDDHRRAWAILHQGSSAGKNGD